MWNGEMWYGSVIITLPHAQIIYNSRDNMWIDMDEDNWEARLAYSDYILAIHGP